MEALVTQVLEPLIGNYFRNASQKSDVIDFLTNRTERQEEARMAIETALKEYDVGAVGTLIGDIVPPGDLMKTLTDRKIAQQQKETFKTQKEAQEGKKDLEQAIATANTQAGVVAAERSVEISKFTANAAIEKANGDAKAKMINAEADAKVLELVGEATGKKITAVGTAEAGVIQLKTNAVGPGNYAMIEVANSLSKAGVALVPQIIAGGGSGSGGGSLVDVLLANLVAKDLNDNGGQVRKVKPAKPAEAEVSVVEPAAAVAAEPAKPEEGGAEHVAGAVGPEADEAKK